MKYLIFKRGDLEHVVIFDPLVSHAEMAAKIGLEVVGAGKVFIREIGSTVSQSVSLKRPFNSVQSGKDKVTIDSFLDL